MNDENKKIKGSLLGYNFITKLRRCLPNLVL